TEEDEPSAYQRHLYQRVAEEQLRATVVSRFSPGVRSLIGHPALRGVIIPSRVEPFGRIPMEVYSHPDTAGVVVVAASAGGLGEVVIDGRTGFAFPAGSAGGLAHAIVKALATSPQECEQLRAAGRRLIAARYTYE